MDTPSYFLSKSSFIRGVQCERSFYLHKHHPSWKDRLSAEQKSKFDRGHTVGELAHRLFPGGKLAYVPGAGRQNGLTRTATLIEQGHTTLYEAAFEWQGVLVILDILYKKDGEWYAYEVKSSRKITETYELDASLQFFIIEQSGLPLKDISIIYIDETCERAQDLEIQKLFTTRSVLGIARFNEPFIRLKIEALKQVHNKTQIPDTDIGLHCSRPYECDYKNYCWSHVPSPSVFDIQGLTDDKKFALYYNGTLQAQDVPEHALSDFHQKIQVQSYQNQQDLILKEPLQQLLVKLTYPRYYLHIEYIQPAIPLFKGTRPYQAVPYLLSLGYHAQAGAPLRQTAIVVSGQGNPFDEAAAWLNTKTSITGNIAIYGLQHWPEQDGYWKDLKSRLVNIALPFEEKWVYTKAFHGKADKATVVQGLNMPVLPQPPLRTALEAQQVYTRLNQSFDLFASNELQQQLMGYSFHEMHKIIALIMIVEGKLEA